MSRESMRIAEIATGFERIYVKEYCNNWTNRHLNCKGCAFELPCTKYLDIMMLYDDCGVLYTRDAEIIAKVIIQLEKARTIEEAEAIFSAVPTNGEL